MKKILSFIFALLLLAGVANASVWVADPRTTEGSASLKIDVYNNSGGALDAGDVVIWDIGSSTGDDDLYVTTTTTAETSIVAGVVWPAAIASGGIGSIVVYGFAQCDIGGASVAANSPVCTSTTAGGGKSCTDASVKYAIQTVATAASGSDDCFVNVK